MFPGARPFCRLQCSVCLLVCLCVQISLIQNYSHIFSARLFISSGIIGLPKGQKVVGPDFLFWAPFAIFGPKRAQNGPKSKNRTSPSVFQIGFSFFQYVLSLIRQKKLLDQNFDLWPNFRLRSLWSQNSPKFENRTSRSSFQLRFLHASDLLS